MNKIKDLWSNLFLIERPSLSLSAFRIVVALTTGFHVIPTLYPLSDNYFSTALRTTNPSFFPRFILDAVHQSPDILIAMFAWLFIAVWVCFLIGFFSQISCIAMTVLCYYFYALNAFHIGTLSWDILLVTLVIMCVTNYPGDYFSVDSLRRGDAAAYRRERPYFIQRLLQMQLAFTFFYTGLFKIFPAGNWLDGNPIYYLMNYPPEGVVKHFFLKEFFAVRPMLCKGVGLVMVFIELTMPLWLFWRKTRLSAIYLGIAFHVILILTLDVPAIFFFLFPFMFLLFVSPVNIVSRLEQIRRRNRCALPYKLIYDGHCGFCRASVKMLEVMDLLGVLNLVNYQKYDKMEIIHPGLTREQAHSQLHLIEPDGSLHGGYFVLRRLSLKLPFLFPLILLFYFPGTGWIGPIIYRWVAENRYLLHSKASCTDNACFRKS